MNEIKYPYISKFGGTITMRFNEYQAQHMEIGASSLADKSNHENITREYLANTWGVVESPEHAEFLIELFTSNNISIANAKSAKECKSFYILHGDAFFSQAEKLNLPHLKPITIPMPPKSKAVSDWPQVGDDVFVTNKLTHLREFEFDYHGKVAKCVSRFKSISGNEMICLEIDGFNIMPIRLECAIKDGAIEKPKTPEQEFTDLIISNFRGGMKLDKAVFDALEDYNITKNNHKTNAAAPESI